MEALSQVKGATEPPLLEHTIGEALERAARRWPNAEALVSVHQNIRLTWAQLLAQADAFAAGLLALGLKPGDRVGVWAPNCAEWTIAQLATARAGIIQVNINPAYRSSELEYTLAKVGVSLLICTARFKSSNYVAMVEALVPGLRDGAGVVASKQLPLLRHLVQVGGEARPGWRRFDDIAGLAGPTERETLAALPEGLKAKDAINIQFTSGTTGLPKGATLSHRNILNNAYFVGLGMGLREGDRLCVPVPLYHCFGMVMSNLACMVHGAVMVYPSDGFDPGAVLAAVEAERCTALHGVPTMFIAEQQHPAFATADMSSLRTGLMAGSPCPVEVMRKVLSTMHMTDVGIAYGMTETSPVSFQTAVDDPVERRVSTIGRVQPHLEVKIVDPVSGAVVPRGQTGELCTRGYAVMLGYWDDAERTAEAIDPEGWMHTGDLAVIDAEGYGNIVGRIKDMVIRGGENVYPREVEEFLFRHPKVQDVQIVGVPDVKYGEELCAWIQLKPGETSTSEEITEFCRGQIAHYKMPRYIRFVTEFPMTITGKVQKFQIRAAMIEELGLVVEETA
jgi:fatty-acyl-CoA synthase